MNSAVVQSKGVTFEVSVAGVEGTDTVEQRVKDALEGVYKLCMGYESSEELSAFLLCLAQAKVAFLVFETVRGE